MSKDNLAGLKYDSKKQQMVPVEHWWDLLIRSKESKDGPGQPRPVLANAITAFRHAPEWKDVLAFNEFSLYATTKKPAPLQDHAGGNWTDYDDARATEWLQRNGILVNSKTTAEAVQVVARENPFHPVRDYLRALKWDTVPRLDAWLVKYFGAPDTIFVRAVGSRWLISAVARIFRPGCQVDHTLLLEGPQGIYKSSGLRTQAGDEWFADHLSDLGSKDSRIELHGKWIIELAELDRVRRNDLERVKAFLTARTDHFRVPYGRRAEDVPRSCVFAATVNDQTPLNDETGNRRFWPVRCGKIDIEALARDRDQLWAEAYQRYFAGEVWYLNSPELNAAAAAEQEERYEQDIWEDTVLEWAENPKQSYDKDGIDQLPVEPFDSISGRVTVADILLHAIHKPIDRQTQQDKTRAARCLVHAGWKRKQDRSRGPMRGKWFYVRPE
jgi:putative DNA primase/helicase